MDTFLIGSWWNKAEYEKLTGEPKQAYYNKLAQEIRDTLGLKEGHLVDSAPYECVRKDGFVYIRSWREHEGAWDTYYGALSELSQEEVAAPPDGVILCPCGNKQFYIDYEDYECIGICTHCGTRHSLYSG